MKKYPFIILLFCMFIISGCASLGAPLKPDYKASLKNMAVVSSMGDKIDGMKVGTTIFNNESYRDDFSSFEIDKKIESAISSYLTSRSGIRVDELHIDKDLFKGAFGFSAKEKKSLERLKPILQDLKTQGIDGVLVVSPELKAFADTNRFVRGYGLGVRSFLMIWYAESYFAAKFTLLDTATQSRVFDRVIFRWKDLKFSKWKKSFSELKQSEQDDIKKFLEDVVNQDIPKYLEKHNF